MSLLPNTVVNGNCLEVMKEIDDASIDMILCDLPYGATQNSWDSVIPPAPLWEQYERIIKPNGAILLFGQDKFTATMMLSNPKLHRYNIIWDKVLKSGFLNAKKMPLREHEDIMVFYKSPPPYHPQMTVGEKNHTKGKAVGKQAEDVHSNRSYGNYTLVESPDGNMKYPLICCATQSVLTLTGMQSSWITVVAPDLLSLLPSWKDADTLGLTMACAIKRKALTMECLGRK